MSDLSVFPNPPSADEDDAAPAGAGRAVDETWDRLHPETEETDLSDEDSELSDDDDIDLDDDLEEDEAELDDDDPDGAELDQPLPLDRSYPV